MCNKITDETIKSKYLIGKHKIIKPNIDKYITNDEIEYLINRFDYVESYKEALIRLKYNINIHPVCPVCGKYVKFVGRKNQLYYTTCSVKCAANNPDVINKRKQTDINKYGNAYHIASDVIREKSIQTCIAKYNVDNLSNIPERLIKCSETWASKTNDEKKQIIDKISNTLIKTYAIDKISILQKRKQTLVNKYGENYIDIFRANTIQTLLNKYNITNVSKLTNVKQKKCETTFKHFNVNYPFQSKYIQHKSIITSLLKYGVKYYSQTNEFKEKMLNNKNIIITKINETKRKNGTFNTSQPEEETFELLKSKYPDIIRQYRSDLYPFNCDFYIPSLDLYIEYNGSWTHGKHPFDENNKDDINEYNKLNESESQYNKNAAYNWRYRDVKKREVAKQNNLNYIEFWNIEEVKKYIK